MCIRDSVLIKAQNRHGQEFRLKAYDWLARIFQHELDHLQGCLLYTSDAADERSSVDLGGRRIIKKKITDTNQQMRIRDMHRRTQRTTAQKAIKHN